MTNVVRTAEVVWTGTIARGTGTASGLPLSSLIARVSMIALSTNALPVNRWQSSQ